MDKQLIERVAQAIYEGHRHAGRGGATPFELMDRWQREMWLQAARAGSALVAEECAKVALSVPIESFATIQHRNQVHYQRETTAIAIRAAFPKE